ncbi:hypothetical protein [Lacticaseibacillus parakribbianus]|uniref:hypothetical protein n=1 Tax=Lacticaseibacillus parakribbianus TaxID=2970927 RepID=UPI0021CB2D99|nr:hypothetical protein [Lacticaseibacillus parakribbianus]
MLALIFSCMLQQTSIVDKASSAFFYLILISWTQFGDLIISNMSDLSSATFGLFAAELMTICLTWSLRAQQLASPYSTRVRVFWGFTHPNMIGSLAEILIFAALTLLILQWKKIFRTIKWYALLIIAVQSVYIIKVSDSRTSLFSTIVFVGFLALEWLRRVSKKWFLFVLISLLPVVTLVAVNFVQSYLLNDVAFMSRLNFGLMKATPLTALVGNGMVSNADLNMSNMNGAHGEMAAALLFYKNGISGIIGYVAIFGNLWLHLRVQANHLQKIIGAALLSAILVGSIGEAYIVNITNVFPMLGLILLSSLTYNQNIFQSNFERNLLDESAYQATEEYN